jgi:hypothetical protein
MLISIIINGTPVFIRENEAQPLPHGLKHFIDKCYKVKSSHRLKPMNNTINNIAAYHAFPGLNFGTFLPAVLVAAIGEAAFFGNSFFTAAFFVADFFVAAIK